MLTNGQILFSLFFIVAFVTILVISYKKDKKGNPRYFKNSKWILIGFVLFVLLLISIKMILKE